MQAPETRFLFEMFAELQAPLDVGATPEGHRIVIITSGGTVSGPEIRGTVVPASGGDWARIRSDGTFALDVRVCLKTDDGALIYMTYGGRAAFKDGEQMAAALDFSSSDPVDPATYYFRTNPIFETSDPRYARLNGVVAVGQGALGHGGVTYRIFEIL